MVKMWVGMLEVMGVVMRYGRSVMASMVTGVWMLGVVVVVYP